MSAVDGLYVAVGCNEVGVTHAPGYGRLLTELLTTGTTELCSIETFDPDRFGDAHPTGRSVVEALQRTREAI